MKYTKEELEMARKILQKHVPNRYPKCNNWINAMLEYGDYIKNNVALVAVSNGALPPQLCKDCKNLPCDNYEKHLKCKKCVFRGNQQSNFEQKSVQHDC